jgi:hypothetical protein
VGLIAKCVAWPNSLSYPERFERHPSGNNIRDTFSTGTMLDTTELHNNNVYQPHSNNIHKLYNTALLDSTLREFLLLLVTGFTLHVYVGFLALC